MDITQVSLEQAIQIVLQSQLIFRGNTSQSTVRRLRHPELGEIILVESCVESPYYIVI